MSASIDTFLEFCKQKPNSPEGKIAEAYSQALLDFDNKQMGLLRHLRPQKANGKLIPVFVEGSEQLIAGFEEAEKHLKVVQADIETYLELTEGHPSMNLLLDTLHRAKLAITGTSFDARRALERALRDAKSSSMEEIEDLPAVQAAMDKRDQAQRQFGPVVEDLQDRISRAKAILEKYNKMEL
jgi:hypothetical protein